jgi:hypothetical protein
MRNKIPRISNEEVISAFSLGIANMKMKEKLSMNNELTSVVRLFKIVDRCAKAEAGRLFMHSLPEVPPPKSKSKDPKRKEAAALMMEPDRKQHCGDRSKRDKGGRRCYCILHKRDTRNTNDYWVIQKFHDKNGVTKHCGSSRSYGRGSSRGGRRNDVWDEGRRRNDPSRTDLEPPPLAPLINDHREENQGATKSHEALLPASWEELKLRYQIVTSSSCREHSLKNRTGD